MYLTNDRGKQLSSLLHETFMYKFAPAHLSKQSEINRVKHFQSATFIPNCAGGIDSGLVQSGLYSLKTNKQTKVIENRK